MPLTDRPINLHGASYANKAWYTSLRYEFSPLNQGAFPSEKAARAGLRLGRRPSALEQLAEVKT